MQSVPIITIVVGSNPTHGDVYSIQHYVITFVSDMGQCYMFFSDLSGFHHQWNVPPRYSWNIVESGIKCHNLPPIFFYSLFYVFSDNISMRKEKSSKSVIFKFYVYLQTLLVVHFYFRCLIDRLVIFRRFCTLVVTT